MVMTNSLSVGMVLAFIAYKGQLTDRFANLIEQIIQFKMMCLHLDRIADIALTEQEANREGEATFSNSEGQDPKGQLTLEKICFSYSDEQAPILDSIIASSEASISGPSIIPNHLVFSLVSSEILMIIVRGTERNIPIGPKMKPQPISEANVTKVERPSIFPINFGSTKLPITLLITK